MGKSNHCKNGSTFRDLAKNLLPNCQEINKRLFIGQAKSVQHTNRIGDLFSTYSQLLSIYFLYCMEVWQTTWRKVNTLWSSWCAEGQGQHDKIKSLCCMKILHITISSSKTCNWRVREMSEIFKNARCLGYYFDPDYIYKINPGLKTYSGAVCLNWVKRKFLKFWWQEFLRW